MSAAPKDVFEEFEACVEAHGTCAKQYEGQPPRLLLQPCACGSTTFVLHAEKAQCPDCLEKKCALTMCFKCRTYMCGSCRLDRNNRVWCGVCLVSIRTSETYLHWATRHHRVQLRAHPTEKKYCNGLCDSMRPGAPWTTLASGSVVATCKSCVCLDCGGIIAYNSRNERLK